MALTIVAPIKPGAVHRLRPNAEPEIRILEAISALPLIIEAAERGEALARGRIDARGLDIGSLAGRAIIKAFERTEVRPLTGVLVASIVMSTVYGYYSTLGRTTIEDSLRRIVRLLYSAPPEDSLSLLRALEAVADRELVLALEKEMITTSKIESGDITLGDIFEILSPIDYGFQLNIKYINKIISIKNSIKRYNNIFKGIINAYISLLPKEIQQSSKLSYRELSLLDKRLDNKYNRVLGALFAGLALTLLSEPLSLPPP